MGLTIEDGAGRGFSASVSESNRLNVSGKVAARAYYVSRDDKLAFTVSSVDASAAAGDYIFYIKNTSSTRNLYMGEIHVGAFEAVLWKCWHVTGTSAGSSALTPVNLNLSSGISAEATSRGDGAITGLTAVSLLHRIRSNALDESTMSFIGALILAPGDAIAVEYDTGTTGTASVTCEFHYEAFDRKN